MSERNIYVENNACDARWFLALKGIKRPLLFHSLLIPSSVLESEKLKMLNTEGYNPIFEYPNLDINKVKSAIIELRNLRALVCQYEADSSIATAYIDKIDEILLEQDLLLSVGEKQYSYFNFVNQKLFGDFDTSVVEGVIEKTPHNTAFNRSLSAKLISDESFSLARSLFDGIDIEVSDATQVFDSRMIQESWRTVLDTAMPGWKVLINDSVLHVVVRNRTRTIHIPKDLKISAKKMRKLFLHEIGTHVYRRELGKKSKLQLLSIGLAGYQTAEEGIAIVREQLMKKSLRTYGGHDKYYCLALAKGLIDGTSKDFRTTFFMILEYYKARKLIKHSPEVADRIAVKRAWGSTVRIFRGGDTSLPGSCFMRDKIYREGNIKIWKEIENSPESFRYVFCGKYDPTNSEQLDLVKKFMVMAGE